jgi:hypothetical protein
MTNTVGKISGQVLESNLVRQGIDLAFETDLLYLNVNSNRIGINSDTPLRTLYVNSAISSNDLLVDNPTTIGDLEFNNSTITSTNNIVFYATGSSPRITTKTFQVDGIEISSLGISSLRSNENIDIFTSGTGSINLKNNTEVFGNLHATGNITFDGSIIFGSDNTDNVTINADILGNIIPDSTDTYTLGSNSNVWSDLHTNLVNGTNYVSGGAIVNGIDLSLRAGNIWYVSANGNNSNVGDHPNGPFSTIEYALAQATSGDTVYIYPGTYIELFPLIIPEGVTVKGAGIRDVKIVPDTASTYEDVFKLNGQTTVEDLTIADFYYDNINDKGYAFSFNSSLNVTSRSPYIRNVSVITKGSVISGSDPLGFDQGDAGRGAKIDGAMAISTSVEASMLFHSATFICPAADTIVMKNHVRVEWLNCFIYYANRGLYAENGTAGFAGLGLDFGAEVRSIGSANVYGNYGAYADGDEVLMYLINHNFGYIGAGKDTSNDPTNVIQANEIVRINDGKIYYQSMDHKGDFRVGDIFRVVSSTGDIEFQTSVVSNTSINITDGTNTTYIDATEVSTGNIRISGNTIESIIGPLNFNAANNIQTINTNLNINANILVTGDVDSSGNISLGSNFNTTQIAADIVSNLIPNTINFNLGNSLSYYKNLYASQLLFDNINIQGNLIETTESNSDLELAANGTGSVLVANNDLLISQNLSVNGLSTFLNVAVSNNTNVLGNTTATINNIDEYYNGDILITENYVTTTQSNSPLELRANSLGGVIFDQTIKIVDSSISNILLTGSESDKSINFVPYTNFIVNISNNSALRIPVGSNLNRTLINSGEIRFNSSNLSFEGKIVEGTKSLVGLTDFDNNTFISAESTPGSNNNVLNFYNNNILSASFNNNQTQFNKIIIDEIEIDNNVIRTTNTNADIELNTSGTGILSLKNNFSVFTNIVTNIVNNATTEIRSTGAGYVKFTDSKGLLIPYGTDAERPAGVPTGASRYNTDQGYLEVWDGTTWAPASGGGPVVSSLVMEDLSDTYALIFG